MDKATWFCLLANHMHSGLGIPHFTDTLCPGQVHVKLTCSLGISIKELWGSDSLLFPSPSSPSPSSPLPLLPSPFPFLPPPPQSGPLNIARGTVSSPVGSKYNHCNGSFLTAGALRTCVLCLLVNPALVRSNGQVFKCVMRSLQTEMRQRVCKGTVHRPKVD